MAKPNTDSNVTDETIRKHWQAVSDLKRKLEEANGVYRAALKAAKNDGVDNKVLIACMAEKKQEEDLLLLEQRTQQRYRQLFNIPTIQQDMFLASEDPEMGVWEARQLGYASGKRGDDPNSACPYPAGTKLFVVWHDDFDKGREAGAAEEAMLPNTKVVSPTRKPGRPKKSAAIEAGALN